MKRRDFLKTVGATTAGMALGESLPNSIAAPGSNRPNLLFVLADQWRQSAFGHGSDPLVRTPHIDRLAEQGACWTRAYSTNPVCTPNRSCILTGRFCHQTGMINNGLMIPPSEKCIAETFRDAGYATHYIGKWHLDGGAKPGFVPHGWRRRGFQTFEGFNRGHFYYDSPTFSDDGKPMDPEGYEPKFQTDLAIDFLKMHTDQPFYCYLSWGPPHTPFNPPEDFDLYDQDRLEWRPNVPQKLQRDPRVQRQLAGYYGLCESLDHEMGRLMTALEELDLAKDTLVVFTSDHGELLASHSLYRKGRPEDESLHVPLIMRLPGRVKAGQKPDTLVSGIDLMPTLISMCGLEVPDTCSGLDLSAAALGGRSPKVDSIYGEGKMQILRPGGAWRSVVTHQHKIAVDVTGKVTHLFDSEKDPYEMKNLANERQHASLQKHMLALLRRWAKETGDPFPDPITEAKNMYTKEEHS